MTKSKIDLITSNEQRSEENESQQSTEKNVPGTFEILRSVWVLSAEDLYNVDAFKLESLAARNKALNEQIARLEQEREKEPVSNHVYTQT